MDVLVREPLPYQHDLGGPLVHPRRLAPRMHAARVGAILQVLADSARWQASTKKWRDVLCTPDGRIGPGLEAWLARQCDVEVIRIGAEAGDEDCQRRLALWQVRMAEYRRLAAAGDKHAQRMVETWRGVGFFS